VLLIAHPRRRRTSCFLIALRGWLRHRFGTTAHAAYVQHFCARASCVSCSRPLLSVQPPCRERGSFLLLVDFPRRSRGSAKWSQCFTQLENYILRRTSMGRRRRHADNCCFTFGPPWQIITCLSGRKLSELNPWAAPPSLGEGPSRCPALALSHHPGQPFIPDCITRLFPESRAGSPPDSRLWACPLGDPWAPVRS